MSDAGVPVVLTADRILMARYDVLLDGMMAASQTTTTPGIILSRLLAPPAPHPGGRAAFAPLGLRRIEAALHEAGLPEDEVAVVDEHHLAEVIGPGTRVVAISSGEPSGLGMSSTTMAAVAGGRIWPHALFERLLGTVGALVARRAPGARVILGGPGAWQVARDVEGPGAPSPARLDHVVVGYAEGNAGRLFRALVNGDDLPRVLAGEGVRGEHIPRVRGATTMGVVEISRGCGLGCGFCTLGAEPMTHLPEETVLADVVTNLSAGMSSIAMLSEDLFRYGAGGLRCRPDRLLGLLERLRGVGGLRLVQADHANVVSVAQFGEAELAEVCALLNGAARGRMPWVNVGVETASGRLLAAQGGAAKMGGIPAEEWGEVCGEQVRRLCAAGFSPMVSLMVGLPGESAADLEKTARWVDDLGDLPVTVFPVLYAPVDGSEAPDPRGLRRPQWRLIRDCYERNFRRVPRLYWDDQTGAGAGLGKRLVLQALGRLQVVQWRVLLAMHQRRAGA